MINVNYVLYGVLATIALGMVLAILRLLIAPGTAKAIAEVSTTNLVVFLACALTILVVLSWIMKCVFLGAVTEPPGMGQVITLISIMLGVGGTMHAAKRFSYKPAPPAGPDIEDAKAIEPDAVVTTKPALPPDLQHALGGRPSKRPDEGEG